MYTGPKIVKDNLLFYYDIGNVKSYTGRPTTNIGIDTYNNYNNVPANVTTTLVATSELYNGSIVYRQTLTPLNATGVSQLTNANNPGLGIFISNIGGGLANRSTGHSIFFKPMAPLFSTPILTNYSNIVGWQSSNQYDTLSDGWFRAKVIWYDTVTRTDSKYWAINPLYAKIGVPITIYWAGSFKEDLNSPYLSQYTTGTRSVTQGLLPLLGNTSLDLTNMSYDSNTQLTFNGTSNYFDINQSFGILSQYTIEYVSYTTVAGKMPIAGRTNTAFYKYGDASWYYTHGGVGAEFYHGTSPSISGYMHCVITYDGANVRVYRNNNYAGAQVSTGTANFSDGFKIGSWTGAAGYFWNGTIPIVKIYNRALSSTEITNNYNTLRTRFNI
jgi:hypothetical protein